MPDSLQEYVDATLAVYIDEMENERALSMLHASCDWEYAGSGDASIPFGIYDDMCTEAAIEIGRIITGFDHEAVRGRALAHAMREMDEQDPDWRDKALRVSGSEYPPTPGAAP